MAIITINETKRQKPKKVANEFVKKLSNNMNIISRKIMDGEPAYKTLISLGFTETRLLNNIRGEKNSVKALEKIYNYILFENGDGVLREYSNKKIAYHRSGSGGAIQGMECSNPNR